MPGSTSSSSSGKATISGRGKGATSERTVQKFTDTANGISGTAIDLAKQLKEIEQDIAKDKEGMFEFNKYLTQLNIKKAELEKRIEANKTWIANFENNNDNGAFEAQYKKLLDDIQSIYNNAKESHGKGIDMLIKDFNYHLAYKRWDDTFTAVPFKPK